MYDSAFRRDTTDSMSYNARALRRVGVIRAAPGCGPTRLIVAVDDANHGPVRAGNHEERSQDDHEDAPEYHGLPLEALVHFSLAPVVVQPHSTHGLEADQGAEQGTDKGDETAENGDGAGDDVGDAGAAAGAADPGHPVDLGVAGKVSGSSQKSDEEVLGGKLIG